MLSMSCSSLKSAARVDPRNVQSEIGFFDKYELADVLGRGAYGTVHLAYATDSHEQLAVKILDLKGGRRQPMGPIARQVHDDVCAELAALSRIRGHRNVVGFREAFIDVSFAYFVIELCTGSLLNAWRNEPDLNEYTYARYFKDMARALAHIHAVGVLHRDVKHDNFMVGAPDGRTVKLCDFGLSAVIHGHEGLSGQPGTPPYMAPEMLGLDATHGQPVDVWAFGVIVYTAFFGCWPYQPSRDTALEMKKAILKGDFQPSFTPPQRSGQSSISDSGIRFAEALLDRNPLRRPSAASCLKMPYLTRRCIKLQGDERRVKSLRKQLRAATKCGVFDVKTPEADSRQQRRLRILQSTAQLRRELCLSNRSATNTLAILRQMLRLMLWERTNQPG